MENGAIYRAGRLVAAYSGDMERVFLHNGGTAFRDAEDSLYRNLYDLAGLDQMNPQAVFERSCKRDVALILINQEDNAQILPPLTTSLPQGAYSSLLKDIFQTARRFRQAYILYRV
ncbi:hypothetical protein JI735_17205 [Paenibacillus sonchi]|uniref:Uncharacterized protein n=1 Tax=Paenibacillus sonchi TaxID=373687 RepID=A0A974P7J6_9BACL|nr:hypothetical protein [Paenibacillus sonchi]QQZ58546.1 hypothetical protein JI735_17205 [Paenibacillus sonchi]